MKDSLSSYDQMLALDLKSDYPDINGSQLNGIGVHCPTMGEVRLIHVVANGEKIPDAIAAYCKNLVDEPEFGNEIDRWNTDPQRIRDYAKEIVAGSMARQFSLTFHRYREHSDIYLQTLTLAVDNFNIAQALSKH